MNILFEKNLVQNQGLASCAVFEAVAAFSATRNAEAGMPFPMVFLVLPLAFHKRTVDSIKSRAGKGMLFKAIKDNPEIPLGLQTRMEGLYDRTFEALSLAVCAETIALDPETGELLPRRKALPDETLPMLPPAKDVLRAARRIGASFAEHSIEEILTILKVVF